MDRVKVRLNTGNWTFSASWTLKAGAGKLSPQIHKLCKIHHRSDNYRSIRLVWGSVNRRSGSKSGHKCKDVSTKNRSWYSHSMSRILFVILGVKLEGDIPFTSVYFASTEYMFAREVVISKERVSWP